jgi:hypothetical protein
MMTLPKRLLQLIDEFDDASQTHGWELDQGSEDNANVAEKAYLKAKWKLLAYLNRKLRS